MSSTHSKPGTPIESSATQTRYPSVDALQKALAGSIFQNRTDVKKAAGRALGTIVELMTFYILQEWGFLPNLSIERGLAEFGNDAITHNVEFGLHKAIEVTRFTAEIKTPITAAKAWKFIESDRALTRFRFPAEKTNKSVQLLSSDFILRNSCTIAEFDNSLMILNLCGYDGTRSDIGISKLKLQPFAMIECKRVGIEDGQKKGPTTIEKAKQGAYVAKHVSALQKVRARDGSLYGAMPMANGGFEFRELSEELRRLIYDAPATELEGFILTVGVVSNHGNWFTAENMNKELLVLNQSYDWLLFLTDAAISEFVSDTILSDAESMSPIKDAFSASYSSGESGKNQFTKVRIDLKAHVALSRYFHDHIDRIEKDWFNILSPVGSDIYALKRDLKQLSQKL